MRLSDACEGLPRDGVRQKEIISARTAGVPTRETPQTRLATRSTDAKKTGARSLVAVALGGATEEISSLKFAHEIDGKMRRL
jgi:hypothetical protein